MSVTVIVKSNKMFGKKLELKDILTEELSYGITDEYGCLTPDESGDVTVIYERSYLSRGIEVSFEDKSVSFRLSLPNCPREIELFYMIVSMTCKRLRTKVFCREGETADLSSIEQFIQKDIDASKGALEYMEENIKSDNLKSMIIFGVVNPVSVGLQDLESFGGDLNKLGDFLNQKQQMDVYYATPHIYKKSDGKLFGCYSISVGVASVVPTEPSAPLLTDKNFKIDEWYVLLGHWHKKEDSIKTVSYEDFIGFFNQPSKQPKYYDVNHILVTMTDDDFEELYRLYKTEI